MSRWGDHPVVLFCPLYVGPPLEVDDDLILGRGENPRAARVGEIRALSGRTIGWQVNYD